MASVVTPPCGPDCLRQRKLDALKLAMDTAEKNGNTVAYNEARTSYYTLLKGQGWLVAEKQDVAQKEIEPVLGKYAQAFQELESKNKSQHYASNLASAVKSHEEDNLELKKVVEKTHDRAAVAKRMSEVSPPTTNFSSYLPWILDGVIALLGLALVFMIYRRVTYVPTVVEQVEQVLGGRIKSR